MTKLPERTLLTLIRVIIALPLVLVRWALNSSTVILLKLFLIIETVIIKAISLLFTYLVASPIYYVQQAVDSALDLFVRLIVGETVDNYLKTNRNK